ncbi:GntR family transcriptional regulator [Cellulomonas phragmiteti]|uniref:GntR family transcriptional regulator n=1 Tax=Cellulomonas phragmiteti TaxID=478780 RepID=UPI0019404FFD|nr:GntR family transcriptional regulator [Cellulomonas phragmiteti]
MSPSDVTRADAPVTAHVWVRERIREAIFSGVYAPGARLVQGEIADRFGTSVTPVREAMRDLANDGLIEVHPQRAATVRDVDLDEAVEINEMRLLLEPLAARRAAERITEPELAALRRAEHEMEAAPDHATWLELNRRFHLEVIAYARSPRLGEVLRNLRQISSFYLAALVRAQGGDREKSAREHRELLDAFAQHDGDRAAEVMTRHLADAHLLRERLGPAD